MKIVNSQWYGALELLSNLLILNFLWLISCLPVITIFPATTAMYSVIRRWKRNGETKVLSVYFHFLRRHFKQGIFIGALWGIFLIVFYLDFQLFFTNRVKHDYINTPVFYGPYFSIYFLVFISYNVTLSNELEGND